MTHLFLGFHGGWVPDRPDHRDLKYAPTYDPGALAPKIDERGMDAPIYDQGQLGSCTANAGAGAFIYELRHQGLDPIELSRLQLYYMIRAYEGTTRSDAGGTIRDTARAMATFGIAPEADWPYDVSKFDQMPPLPALNDAKLNRLVRYERLDNSQLTVLKDCLNSGFGFIFGFTVCQSFRSVGTDGLMPVPWSQEAVLGGHAVRAVGYDNWLKCPNAKFPGAFIIANSWGTGWGDKGYFYFPYEVITNTNYCDDFWAIRLVTPDV